MTKVSLKDLSEGGMLAAISEHFEEQTEDSPFSMLEEYCDGDGYELTELGWLLKYTDGYGGEGKGDEYWFVFTVSDEEVTRSVKMEGYYASHDGGYYDEWHETFPELQTITVWS